jgi:monoamine oxidase
VLQHIAVTPAFSEGKQQVIQNMHYGEVTRVYLQTRSRYWEKSGCSGFADVDQPMEIWSPSWNMPGNRGLLMAYTYNRLAQQLDEKTPEQRIAWFTDLVEKVHPGIRDSLEGAHTWSWQLDPFQKGAFCVFYPHDPENFAAHVRSVEGRIHFAGEHTSPWPGWIQGAIYSGQRAAREVGEA